MRPLGGRNAPAGAQRVVGTRRRDGLDHTSVRHKQPLPSAFRKCMQHETSRRPTGHLDWTLRAAANPEHPVFFPVAGVAKWDVLANLVEARSP